MIPLARTGAARRLLLAAALSAACFLPPEAARAETRSLHLYNIHTHENLIIVFKRDGRFEESALKRLNAFLRDWRKEEEVKMDPQLFDMLWEVHREVKATGPIHVVSGYRSPNTNAMLRRRSGGVARTSLHMQGKAIDFSIPTANVADVRAAALRIQGGGVGYYPTSGVPFVHMDVGNVRHWPRMTREQLAKVFPDGRTVHVPSDGNPLPGYELAAADLERGNNRRASQPQQRSLIASLFNAGQDAEETADRDTAQQASAPASAPAARRPAPTTPAPVQVAAAPEPKPENVPLPRSRPTYQVAAAESRPVPAPLARRVADPVTVAALSPNDIISARGFWQDQPDTSRELPKVASAAPSDDDMSSARRLLASSLAAARSDVTATVGPFARADRVPAEMVMAYASEADAPAASIRPAAAQDRTVGMAPAALVSIQGAASVAVKPALKVANGNVARNAERLSSPWLHGLAMAPSVQNSMIVTLVGDTDFRTLTPYLWKPRTAVMMTFSHDPHLGMTAEAFSGSAIVFQATVTFDPRRTASLQ